MGRSNLCSIGLTTRGFKRSYPVDVSNNVKLSVLKLKTYDDPAPDSPLICGNAVHHGIEMGEDAGIEWYYKQFYGINDKYVNEDIKLRYSIEQMRREVDYERAQFEFELNTPDFKGFIDCMEYVDDTTVDLLDFKYANPKNTWRYEQSGQLHVYAKKLLDHCGITVRNMAYLVMPKTMIRQKKTESIMQFRRRLQNELHPIRVPISKKVFEFDSYCNQILEATEYPKQPGPLCRFCDLQEYCESEGEIDYMILPENKRVAVDTSQPPVIWLYGQPFSGKTTFANQAPEIHLNTDGNVKYVDGARIIIREEVTMEGRLKKIKYAWENFIEAVDLLIAGQHEFKNVTVDLVEDVFEMCTCTTNLALITSKMPDSGRDMTWFAPFHKGRWPWCILPRECFGNYQEGEENHKHLSQHSVQIRQQNRWYGGHRGTRGETMTPADYFQD